MTIELYADGIKPRFTALKKEHGDGNVIQLILSKDDEETEFTHCFLKKPDRTLMGRAISVTGQGDIFGGTEIVLENCWIEGDENIKTNDDLFYSAHFNLKDLISFRKGELAKK